VCVFACVRVAVVCHYDDAAYRFDLVSVRPITVIYEADPTADISDCLELFLHEHYVHRFRT
jgi:hypothetical protein